MGEKADSTALVFEDELKRKASGRKMAHRRNEWLKGQRADPPGSDSE
jgi:hypothetical protein